MTRLDGILKPFKLLSRRDHIAVASFGVFSFVLGILDLIGVALIGLLGSLAVSAVQSLPPGNTASKALSVLGIQNFGIQNQVMILGLIATFTFVLKTVISVFGNKRLLSFLAKKDSVISAKIFFEFYNQEYSRISKLNTQEVVHHVTSGVNSMIMGVIANFVALLSDVIVIFILMLGLFLVNLALGFSSVIFFGLLGVVLYLYTNSNAKSLGHQEVMTSFELNKLATTALVLNKEMTAVSRKTYFNYLFEEKRRAQASILSRKAFLPNISKYVLEIGLVAGTMLIAAFQFLITDAKHAVAFVAIFLVSGTRIGPALLRAHQSLLIVSASLGASSSTLRLIDEYNLLPGKIEIEVSPINSGEESLSAHVDGKLVIAENLSFTYPATGEPIFSRLNLDLKSNTLTVFVGKSGSGKTTALDLLAGINLPTQGSLKILGYTPRDFASKFPGSISYLPQETKIFDATIRENVCVGYPSDFFSDNAVWKALEEAQLKEFVEQMADGLDHRLVENGRGMSGGQKQRIGIARSLITRPKLLLMDEPTSALDSETESGFLEIIERLKSSTTLVIATHRLQILELADYTFFFDPGKEVSELDETLILEKLKE